MDGDPLESSKRSGVERASDYRSDLSDRFSDFSERLEGAAVEAEYDTGTREQTEEKAKAHIFIRLARMTAGFLTVIIGIALLPLPGPGWVVIAGGLVILAQDFEWAEKTLRYVRRKAPGIPEDGKIPMSTWVSMVVVMGLALGGAFLVRRYIDLSDTWASFLDLF